MLKSVNATRTGLNVLVREGYEAGTKERWDAKSVPGNCTCVNCGEQFSNRRKLRYHYTKCPHYVNFQRTNENGTVLKGFKCARCGKKFVGKTLLAFHQERCGYYVAMHQTDTGDTVVIDTVKTDTEKESDITEINDDVIIIGDGDEPDNEEAVVETEDLNSKKNEQNEVLARTDFTIPDIKVVNAVATDNPSTVNQLEDTKRADPVQISKHVRETVKIKTELMKEQKTHFQKRKYDGMLSSSDKSSSDQSQMTPKKIKSQEEEKPLYKLLIDDMHQEHRQNIFDRVSTGQRSYRCPKCSIRFKYKHKFDIHVKFAHIQSGSLVTATDLKATRPVPENDYSATGFTESKESKDRNSVLNGMKKSGSSPNDNYTGKPWIGNYPCDFCHMSFRYYSRCERHIKSVHKEQEDQLKFGNIFRCTECQERLPDKYALLKHYNRHHLRNANKPTVSVKAIYEQFNNILNVNDVMKHLRKNLTCLQDGKSTETDQSDSEPRIKMTDHFRDSNQSTGRMFNKSEGEMESHDRDVSTSDVITTDISEKTTDTGKPKRETAARKKISNVCNFDPKLCDNTFTGDYVEKKEPFGIQKNIIRNYCDSSEYDKPLDLSTKTKSRTEHDTPFGTRDKVIAVDKKSSDSERVLLMEYYKDFLHEYGLK